MDNLESRLTTQVRNNQVFTLAMIVVPLIFAGVVLVIGSQAPQNPAPIRGQMVQRNDGMVVLERLALLVGLAALVAQQWIGRFVTRQSVRLLVRGGNAEPERLGEALLTGSVVACAVNEMAAFTNLIAFMPTQSWMNWTMGVLLIASNALKWPRVGRVAAWARAEEQRLRGVQGAK